MDLKIDKFNRNISAFQTKIKENISHPSLFLGFNKCIASDNRCLLQFAHNMKFHILISFFPINFIWEWNFMKEVLRKKSSTTMQFFNSVIFAIWPPFMHACSKHLLIEGLLWTNNGGQKGRIGYGPCLHKDCILVH